MGVSNEFDKVVKISIFMASSMIFWAVLISFLRKASNLVKYWVTFSSGDCQEEMNLRRTSFWPCVCLSHCQVGPKVLLSFPQGCGYHRCVDGVRLSIKGVIVLLQDWLFHASFLVDGAGQLRCPQGGVGHWGRNCKLSWP